MLWPWPLTFWPQNVISSSLSRDAPVTKVWPKSVNRFWRYRGNIKLPCESRTDARTAARSHGRTTRKHIASAGTYRWRRLKKLNIPGKMIRSQDRTKVQTNQYNITTYTQFLSNWPAHFWNYSTLGYCCDSTYHTPNALPVDQPTASKHWRYNNTNKIPGGNPD